LPALSLARVFLDCAINAGCQHSVPVRAYPVVAVLFFAFPASAQSPGLSPTVSKIRTDGIGKVKIGMTVKEAREAAGVRMARSRVGDCVDLAAGPPRTGQGPTLRFHDGRLRRVHVARRGFATERGVEVGDRVREVRRKYSGLPRDIDLGGGYTLIWKRGNGRLVFTIGGNRVVEIAGGPVPWVLQQECA
jgi:hypothetical protein